MECWQTIPSYFGDKYGQKGGRKRRRSRRVDDRKDDGNEDGGKEYEGIETAKETRATSARQLEKGTACDSGAHARDKSVLE